VQKLAIIVVNRDIEKALSAQLVAEKFIFTRLGSNGGFLRKKNSTLLIGLSEERVEKLTQILKAVASERSTLIPASGGSPLSTESGLPELPLGAAPITVGGATLFIVPLDRFERV
jgi:uncharacterized protein YaaQ